MQYVNVSQEIESSLWYYFSQSNHDFIYKFLLLESSKELKVIL